MYSLTLLVSRELRLFVSSTFLDLSAEREYLAKRVFPEVRSVCRERGVEFTEIDLRWGLTYEDSALGKVLRTCFEEIDQCRPFFLGILGDRYGWVPSFNEVQKDPALIQNYPWIEDAAIDGWSLVEMEIYYGSLAHSDRQPGVGFFLKTADAGLSDPRQQSLREKIRTSGLPTYDFADPTELGAHVRSTLMSLIDHYWPKQRAEGFLAEQRTAHEIFAASRRRAYIANPDTLRALLNVVENKGPAIAVIGESGAGKSALLSYFENYYRRRHP